MASLEDKFNEIMQKVREHCEETRYLSAINVDYPAYKELVSLGDDALPYLRALIGEKNQPRWEIVTACLEILMDSGHFPRDFSVPEKITGRLDHIEGYALRMIDEFLEKRSCPAPED